MTEQDPGKATGVLPFISDTRNRENTRIEKSRKFARVSENNNEDNKTIK